ncbi:MAG TPA: ABC transporter permease subunit [Methylomirabilota bacterium]|nr:ABC transporter permease subunit [Methylomirabilota bacterium]
MKGRWLLVGISALALLPVVGLLLVVFWMGFWQNGPGEPVVYTLQHYRNILTDSFTYKTLLNTLGFAATTVTVSLFFAIPIAWLVERTDLRGKGVVLTLMAVGALLPTFFTAMGWVFLLHPRIGVINKIIMNGFGLTESPFNIASIVGMGWVEGLGLSSIAFIMVVATYRTMDPSLEEAGRVHGLKVSKTLRYITLPLTFPGVLAAAIYIFTIGLSAFEVPAIIGMSNKIFTFSTFIFYKMQPLEELPNYGVAGAVSSLLVVLALLLSWWYFKVLRFSSRYAVVTGKGYRPKLIELGPRGRFAAWFFLGVFFTIAKLLPLLLLVWAALLRYFQPPSWTALSQVSLRNFYGLPWDLLLAGARNTLLLMVAVPTLTLILCVAISWVILRSQLKWRIVFDALAFLPHAVPSIILALAAVFVALFLLRGAVPLYGTLSILILVYTISRISFATRIINNSLAQIHPELEEAAFAGGLRLLQVMRKILLPLLKPALVYAWLWMALLCYRELTMASVLVTSRNNVTLPMIVWGLWLGGSLNQAAAANLVILAVMLPLVLFYLTFGRRSRLEEAP